MKRKGEAGQALVMAAVGLTVLMLAAGLSIDMGYLRYQKRRQQTAADSAAIAGASQISNCDGSLGCLRQAARTDSSCNGFADPDTDVLCNGSTPDTDVSVQLYNPPIDGPNLVNPNYVEVLVTRSQPTFFMKIAGYNKIAVTARAVAYLGAGNGCFYGLNSLDVATSGGYPVGLTMDVPGCAVFENSSLALNSQILHARAVGCVGSCTGTITPTPVKIVPASDPLSYLPKQPTPTPCTGAPEFPTGGIVSPSDPGCGVTVKGSATVEFTPGSYAGPITIQDSANVTFDPGTYVLGNGLSITTTATNPSPGVTVTGNGVTFYTAGTTGSVDICTGPLLPTAGCPVAPCNAVPGCLGATNAISLSAPTSGDYAGVLVMQDPLNPTPATINGNYTTTDTTSNTAIQGALYFPNSLASLTLINLTSWTSFTGSLESGPQPGYLIAVAQKLYVGGNVDVGNILPINVNPIKAAVLAE